MIRIGKSFTENSLLAMEIQIALSEVDTDTVMTFGGDMGKTSGIKIFNIIKQLLLFSSTVVV